MSKQSPVVITRAEAQSEIIRYHGDKALSDRFSRRGYPAPHTPFSVNRVRAVAMCHLAGMQTAEIATRFRVTSGTVRQWKRQPEFVSQVQGIQFPRPRK